LGEIGGSLGGELRSVTIKRKAGNWYASIAWRAEVADPAPPTLPSVGLDRGVAVFAALSDGTKIGPLNAFEAIRGRLAKAQRKLARKTKFSANWKKQKAKITPIHMRAANARRDFLQKLSTDLAKSYSVIKVEKLQIQNMTRSARGTVDRARHQRQSEEQTQPLDPRSRLGDVCDDAQLQACRARR
jgi:putative transposase